MHVLNLRTLLAVVWMLTDMMVLPRAWLMSSIALLDVDDNNQHIPITSWTVTVQSLDHLLCCHPPLTS